MGAPGKREEIKDKYLKKRMAENFQNLVKYMNVWIKEAKQTPRILKPKRPRARRIKTQN